MNGTSILSETVVGTGSSLGIVRTGDLNGGGKSDLVWQNSNGSNTIWILNGYYGLLNHHVLPVAGLGREGC